MCCNALQVPVGRAVVDLAPDSVDQLVAAVTWDVSDAVFSAGGLTSSLRVFELGRKPASRADEEEGDGSSDPEAGMGRMKWREASLHFWCCSTT